MDIDVMTREIAALKAFREKYEPMLSEMQAVYADHKIQQDAEDAEIDAAHERADEEHAVEEQHPNPTVGPSAPMTD